MSYGMGQSQGFKGSTGGNLGTNNSKDPWDVFRGIKTAESNSMQGPEGYLQGKISQFTPEQTKLFKQSFNNLSPDSYLGRLAGGDEELYNEMEQPALRQFNALQSGIASKFSGQGMGARRSSGFQNTQNQAASDFAQQLQSNRVSLRQQAIKDLMGMSNDLLGQRPYENYLLPEQMPWEQQIGIGAVQGFAQGLGGKLGGKF